MARTLRLNQTLSERAFPHKCERRALEFEVTGFAVNGGQKVEPETEGLVNLKEYEGWDLAELDLKIRVPDGLLGKVFPEYDDIPGRLLVTGHCQSTFSRGAVVVEDAPLSSGTFEKTIQFVGLW